MKTLSVSIAAYNVENYLKQTLDSFCILEVLDDIEILIIDDGSKDATKEIGFKYQQKYPNTFHYIHKKNGGHGSTVNKGIEIATGKYFKVVDGDDWIDKKDFVELVKYLKSTETDLVLTDFSRVYSNGETKKEEYFNQFEKFKEYPLVNVPRFESIAMHSISIKTEILKNNKIRLSEKCFYVDIEYVVYILRYAKNIVYIPYNVYMYRYGTADQSVNVKNMVKNINMRIKVSQGLAQYITEYRNHFDFEIERYHLMKSKVLRMITGTYMVYLAYDNIEKGMSELIMYENGIKQISPELYKESGENIKVKMMRIFNHALFGLENKLYHFFKM